MNASPSSSRPLPTASLPLVSVVIPAYNAEAYLAKTIASVLQQTYTKLEILVVDDGSRDQTAAIVEQMAQQHYPQTVPAEPGNSPNPARPITLLQQSNAGVAKARNLGLEAAQGEWIAPLDADDLWTPDYLEKLVHCSLASPAEVGVVYTWSVDIDEDDRLVGGFHAARVMGRVNRTLLCHNFLGNASCTLIRRDCLRQIGGYDPELRSQQAQGCEDWDLYLRLAEVCEYRVVPEFLVGYRKLQRSMSGDGRQMARSQSLILAKLRQRQPAIPDWLYGISMSSFYLYLADQSNRSKQPHQTQHWLQQAIAVDFTPWLRLGFYLLLVQSGWQRWQLGQSTIAPSDLAPSDLAPSRSPLGSDPFPRAPRHATLNPSPDWQQALRSPQKQIAPPKVWLKITVSQGLHQVVNFPSSGRSRVDRSRVDRSQLPQR
ncbi:MAG: glycosyltransferase family A protein [Synechococcales bacterium]|nr:glycosyltransferase family A protein [Synechococcales bacterium]